MADELAPKPKRKPRKKRAVCRHTLNGSVCRYCRQAGA